MNSQTIVMCVVALLLGMLLANMLKSVCGCKNVEGLCNNKVTPISSSYQGPNGCCNCINHQTSVMGCGSSDATCHRRALFLCQ